jgi:hypothetical protein
MSTSIPSAKELGQLPAFVGAVHGSRNKVASESLLKEVVAETHFFGGLSHSKIQRARDIVQKSVHNEKIELYKYLPTLCQEVIKYNPGSRICCQLDSEERFFRMFMLLQSSVVALNGCLPCIEVDGTFMKHPTYNGICIMVVSKTSDHKNVPIASFIRNYR